MPCPDWTTSQAHRISYPLYQVWGLQRDYLSRREQTTRTAPSTKTCDEGSSRAPSTKTWTLYRPGRAAMLTGSYGRRGVHAPPCRAERRCPRWRSRSRRRRRQGARAVEQGEAERVAAMSTGDRCGACRRRSKHAHLLEPLMNE